MLRATAAGPAVIACSTCRWSAEHREGPDGRTGGTALAEALRHVQASDPALAGIAVEEMPCLWACGDHCVVHLRAPGKIGYLAGRFTPDADSARAILDFARHQADSAFGRVPFADWPAGVKGHFIARLPAEGTVIE